MALDDADRDAIAPYVSSLTDPVYALTGLPDESVAVLFAYDAESADDFRVSLAKLLEADQLSAAAPRVSKAARKFQEEWARGRSAQHATIHLVLEDVSILAAKTIEESKLGAFTEKSR